MTYLNDISGSVQSGNTGQTVHSISQALKEQYPPSRILREGLAAGIMATMKRFHRNQIVDSEVLLAERAMKAGLYVLMPVLKETLAPPIGTVITGTMEGDIRDIEKSITSVLMESLNLKVIDLGVSVSVAQFIEAAIKEKANIIVCSTSLTTFLPQMKSLVQAAKHANIRSKTKILLSGGPVTEWFCMSIDADMYAPDPIGAADMAAEHCKTLNHR